MRLSSAIRQSLAMHTHCTTPSALLIVMPRLLLLTLEVCLPQVVPVAVVRLPTLRKACLPRVPVTVVWLPITLREVCLPRVPVKARRRRKHQGQRRRHRRWMMRKPSRRRNPRRKPNRNMNRRRHVNRLLRLASKKNARGQTSLAPNFRAWLGRPSRGLTGRRNLSEPDPDTYMHTQKKRACIYLLY